jgi:cell division transport system ATP-binding protein
MVFFEQVRKTYRSRLKPALDEINLHIPPGQFVYLSGPSGVGKTTFLRLLFGAEMPSSGRVRVLGADMGSISARSLTRLRRKIGIIFQDFKLVRGLTVYENTALALSVAGVNGNNMAKQVFKTLAQVGLAARAHTQVDTLSGGEQQRVAIARALVGRPKLLLADEPTGNLDPENAREIMRLVVQAHTMGTTVIVATHDPHLIRLVRGPKVIRLYQGRLEQAS